MESNELMFKAVADETRLEIVKLLVKRSYCVGALARRIGLTEAAVSQHLKILREAGLVSGEKHGYFMHYDVNRDALRALAAAIVELADSSREPCEPDAENCLQNKRRNCRMRAASKCEDETRRACHGEGHNGHGNCSRHRNCEGNEA